jgi:parallel beta-helix repeat protein
MTAQKTSAFIDKNVIEDNVVAGILIKDPSLPLLRGNEIQKNFF